jgi:hypothetical protein
MSVLTLSQINAIWSNKQSLLGYTYVCEDGNLYKGVAGIAEINTIQNSTSYVSGTYTVALVKELARLPISTLGLASERNFLFEYPSMPRIYDGAALYFGWGSGAATPVSSAVSGQLNFVWG